MNISSDPFFENNIPRNGEVTYQVLKKIAINKDKGSNENKPDLVSDITFKDWVELCRYNEANKVFNEFDISWSHLLFNLFELVNFIKSNIINKKISTDFEKEGIIRYLNYKLINAVSGVYVFYNNVIGICEKYFDEKLKEEINEIFSCIYDNHFAYRFCYQFRGFVNHKNLPITYIYTDISSNELQLTLDSQKLLDSSNKFSWNRVVKREIRNMEEISIPKLIYDLFSGYLEAFKSLKEKIKSPINEYTEIINKLGIVYERDKVYLMRASWKSNEITTDLLDILDKDIVKSISNKTTLRFFETNVNIATFEIFNDRLGYTLCPDHFRAYLQSLKCTFGN